MADPETSRVLPPPEKLIELQPPAKFAGVEYPRLQLREPTAGQMVESDSLRGYAWMVKITALVAGIPEDAVKAIRVSELLEASDYLGGFIVRAPQTRSDG